MPVSSRRGRSSTRTQAPGWFFAVEGPDGAGKSTQARMLAEALSKLNKTVVLTREPGGTPAGESIRRLILDPDGPDLTPRAELFLFMAARAQLMEEIVNPALEAGRVVVTDRFLLSSIVYQGLAGGIPAGEVEVIGRSATMGTQPDLTVVLDVDSETSMSRMTGEDRIEQRGRTYLERVRQGFLSLAKRDPRTTVVVDGTQTVEEVHAQVLKAVREVLG